MDKYFGEESFTLLPEAISFIRKVHTDLGDDPQKRHESGWRRNAQIVTTGDSRLWLLSMEPGGSENLTTTLEQYLQHVSKNLSENQFYRMEVIDEVPGTIRRLELMMTWKPYVKPQDKKPEYKENSWWTKYWDTVLGSTSGF